jgi:hypothetical protein
MPHMFAAVAWSRRLPTYRKRKVIDQTIDNDRYERISIVVVALALWTLSTTTLTVT